MLHFERKDFKAECSDYFRCSESEWPGENGSTVYEIYFNFTIETNTSFGIKGNFKGCISWQCRKKPIYGFLKKSNANWADLVVGINYGINSSW